MLEDGDRILNLVGVVLVVALVLAVGVIALNFDPPEDDRAPGGNWSVERVNDTHVRVARTSGEPVPADEVEVSVDGLQRNADWTDPIVPGSNTVVTASDGARVRVVWVSGSANRDTLESWQV